MSKAADYSRDELTLEAKIEDRHLQPNLCTIYRPHPDDLAQMEMWITAKECSFTDLESMR
jgi:hypothetical protein